MYYGRIYLSILFFCLLFITPNLFAQEKEKGKLSDFEEQTEKENKNSDHKDPADDNDDDDSDSNGGCFFGDIAGELMVKLLGYTLIGNPFDASSDFFKAGYSYYPYFENGVGLFNQDGGKNYAVIVKASYFRESDKIAGFKIDSRFSPYPLFTFQITYSDLVEELGTRDDYLRLYDLFINYNRCRIDFLSWWWGLGYKGMKGDKYQGGFALNLGIEIYPAKPVSVNLGYNIGFIGNSTVTDFAGGLNFHLDRYQFGLGYQLYRAGSVNINGFTIGFGIYF